MYEGMISSNVNDDYNYDDDLDNDDDDDDDDGDDFTISLSKLHYSFMFARQNIFYESITT